MSENCPGPGSNEVRQLKRLRSTFGSSFFIFIIELAFVCLDKDIQVEKFAHSMWEGRDFPLKKYTKN